VQDEPGLNGGQRGVRCRYAGNWPLVVRDLCKLAESRGRHRSFTPNTISALMKLYSLEYRFHDDYPSLIELAKRRY